MWNLSPGAQPDPLPVIQRHPAHRSPASAVTISTVAPFACMATKLDVIQHRRQGRDYIDIAAMDRAGACTIEDGLRYHKQRYAPTVTYEETLRIAQLATSAPPTDPDPAFDSHLAEAAGHLAARRRAVLDWALQSGQRPRPPQPEPHTHEL